MTTVLFVSRRPPWPLTNGARIRSHRLLEGLAPRFDTILVTMDHGPGSPDGRVDLDELRAALPDVEIHTVTGFGSSKRRDQLTSLVRRASFSFGRYATDAFSREVGRIVEERKVDLVHADDLGAALAVPARNTLDGRPLIAYASHNVESRIVCGDAAAADSRLHRLFATIDCRKLRIEERRVWNSMDLTFAVSEHDAALMRAESEGVIEVCPNGTDPVDPTPLRHREPDDPLRLVFVGSAAYAPYERGLAWFGREVMGALRHDHDVAFDVVGQAPRHAPTAPEIVHRGYVDEVASWYAGADAVVVPVFEGSGTRLKLVEAAAHGRPIVTTELGAQGLPLEPDVHFLRAETASDFVRQIGRIASRTESFESMVDSAREAVSSLMWPNIADSLCDRYGRALEQDTSLRR